ncbi:neuronal acetylcholine receptor subunit alpha-2-like, partial [Patella vulgata]|uniref:neuronal acetylcholine receptor subunit alpha-2-like n=1 Tax=Patella vulgata TaxID=6465 RepID=UPI0024A85F8F
VLTTFCELDMTYFPYDQQICKIHISPIDFNQGQLKFIIDNNSPIHRPTFILLNVYIPVIILSFLNAAVFAVPVDSGEKLSYVLTVLLSLAVFMSTISHMLPTTSNHTPYITIYLSCLIVISTLSVLMTVLIIRFTTFCALDMTHFPFDKQICDILILPIDFTQKQLTLVLKDNFSTHGTRENGEWVIEELSGSNETNVENDQLSRVTVRLTLTRRPTFILLNVYLPVIILSFLNAAVFAVPVDSGEKLSYVLTVLLSLAVFMSTVSGMLPTT